MTIFFHPYILRSLQTTLVGVLFDLLKNNKVVLLSTSEVDSYISARHSSLLDDPNLVVVSDDRFHNPAFSPKAMFKQGMGLKKHLGALVAKYSPDAVVLENDCMSFLTMSLASIFTRQHLPVICIQSLSEVPIELNIELKSKTIDKRLIESSGAFKSRVLRSVFKAVYYRAAYLYVHVFLPVISGLRPVLLNRSYIKMNCVSGQLFKTVSVVFEERAYVIYKSQPYVNAKRLFFIPHPIMHNELPISIFLGDGNIAQQNNPEDLLVMINPVFFDRKDFGYDSFRLFFRSLVKKAGFKIIHIKPHPDFRFSIQKLTDFFDPSVFEDIEIRCKDPLDDVYKSLFEYKYVIDFPPGRSTTLMIAAFISERYHFDKAIMGLTFDNFAEIYTGTLVSDNINLDDAVAYLQDHRGLIPDSSIGSKLNAVDESVPKQFYSYNDFLIYFKNSFQ